MVISLENNFLKYIFVFNKSLRRAAYLDSRHNSQLIDMAAGNRRHFRLSSLEIKSMLFTAFAHG